jgi:hypothetical protein
MTDRDIINTFDRIEREHGGYADVDAREVLRLTAETMGLPLEHVRAVMLDEWCCGGAG